MIDRRCFQSGLWHRRCHGSLWILDNGESAASFYGLEPLRPVGIGAGEHDADQRLGKYIRGALKQDIDGRAGIIYALIDGKAEGAIGFDQQMIARRRQIHVTGAEGLLIFGFTHRNCCLW